MDETRKAIMMQQLQGGQYIGQPQQPGAAGWRWGPPSANVTDMTGVVDPRQTVRTVPQAIESVQRMQALRQRRAEDAAMDPALLQFRRDTEYNQGLRDLSALTQNPGAR